jgi:hypothetical protein
MTVYQGRISRRKKEIFTEIWLEPFEEYRRFGHLRVIGKELFSEKKKSTTSEPEALAEDADDGNEMLHQRIMLSFCNNQNESGDS